MLVSWSISSKVTQSSGRSSQSKPKGFVVIIFTLCSCWPVGILSPVISRIFMLSLSLVPSQVWHAWRFISTKISTKRQVRGILIMSWEDATKNQDIWKFLWFAVLFFLLYPLANWFSWQEVSLYTWPILGSWFPLVITVSDYATVLVIMVSDYAKVLQ